MKLLIDIPEHIYEHAKELTEDSRDEASAMRAIAKGAPLPYDDAISRQAVLDAIMANNIWENEYNLTSSRIKKAVESLPSVTPQQTIGRWIKQNYGWNWQCSECGFVTPPSAKEIFTFCPNCGAKMTTEVKE